MTPPAPITACVLTLGELFSERYCFRLPPFQRAYAWTSDHVARLLADIIEASTRDGRRHHFLGRLLLARAPGSTMAAVVDGHQRIVTLTILFAVLRDMAQDSGAHDGGSRAALASRVAAPACDDGSAGLRLQPQAGLAPFLARFVQEDGATTVVCEEDLDDLSESERNALQNRDLLRAELTALEGGDSARAKLATFIGQCCFVEVLEVDDETEAWAMLQTEEQTRLDFSPTDRAKASIMSAMTPADRRACAPLWDEWQARLGSDNLRHLLGHVRVLELRERSDRPVETDLIRSFALDRDGVTFFQRHLAPRAEHMQALLSRSARAGIETGDPIAASLERAGWIDRQLWMPAALLWLETRRETAESTLFFERLERLVWLMRIAGIDPQVQQARILRLLAEIDSGRSMGDSPSLAIERKLRAKALENLRSRTFYHKSYRNPVLRRISIALGNDPGPIEKDRLTIEHVLPRNPPPACGWWKIFRGKPQIQAHANRLGNLALLTPADNQLLATRDYADKRPILAASGFALSVHAAGESDWTSATIERRTEALIGVLLAAWQLDRDA